MVLGASAAGIGLSDESKVKLDHAILITISKAIEKPMRETVKIISDASRETTKTLRIVGYAAAAYLVMAGVAKLMEAKSTTSSSSRKNNKKIDGSNNISSSTTSKNKIGKQ